MQFLARKCEDGNPAFFEKLGFVVEHVALQTQTVNAERVIDVTVDGVLVYAFLEQLTDDGENFVSQGTDILNISGMFYSCKGLTHLNLSSFNTSKWLYN